MSDQITINVVPDSFVTVTAEEGNENVYLNPITLNQGIINHSTTHISGGSDELLHNALGGLNGGTSGQFYHLTSQEYSNLVTGQVIRPSDTGLFYASSNPSGFITGINNIVYTIGDQNIAGLKNFYTRPQVNGIGVLLSGEGGGGGGSASGDYLPLSGGIVSGFLTVTDSVNFDGGVDFNTFVSNDITLRGNSNVTLRATNLLGLSGANTINITAPTITLSGNVGISKTTPTAKLDILDTTLAGSGGLSGSALNIAQTWNTTGAPTALSVNVTDLSSNASSLLMDLRVGDVSRFKVSKSGSATLGRFATSGFNGLEFDAVNGTLRASRSIGGTVIGELNIGSNSFSVGTLVASNGTVQFASNGDTALVRDAANTLAQRNGLNPQEFRLYNKFNNASDYERFFIKTNVGATSATQIGLSVTGSGVPRNLEFVNGDSTRMTIASSGNVGIGTGTPLAKLHIEGSMGSGADGNDNTAIRLTNSPHGLTWKIAAGIGGVSHGNFFIGRPGTSIPDISIVGSTSLGTIGNVGIGTATAPAKLSIVDTTLAGSAGLSGSALSVNQTWNTTGTPTALSVNVTDLSSNASSLLMDLQVSGVSKFRVDKSGVFSFIRSGPTYSDIASDGNGRILLNSSSSAGTRVAGDLQIGNPDTVLTRDAANTLAQRNGLNPQEFRLYNKFNNASDFERFFIKTNVGATSATQIGLSVTGSGVPRNLEFVNGGSTRMSISDQGVSRFADDGSGNFFQIEGGRSIASFTSFSRTCGITFGTTTGFRGFFSVSNNSMYGFSPTGDIAVGTTDTSFSRISAGIIGVGTGTPGSTAGSLSLTNLTASGGVNMSSFTGPLSGLVEMKNNTTWQNLRLYSTTDNASNFEYITITQSGASWRIGNNKSGTGATRGISLVAQGSVQLGANGGDGWTVNTTKHLFPDGTSNTRDLGQVGSRIRNLYVGTLIDCAGNITTTGLSSTGPIVFQNTTVDGAAAYSGPSFIGAMLYINDEDGGPTMAFYDGANWRRVQDRAIIVTAP